jgi:hypothetical protein
VNLFHLAETEDSGPLRVCPRLQAAGGCCWRLSSILSLDAIQKAVLPPRDIIPTLADAEEYVRGIVGSFIQHGFDKERSAVTIGVSGTGQLFFAGAE